MQTEICQTIYWFWCVIPGKNMNIVMGESC